MTGRRMGGGGLLGIILIDINVMDVAELQVAIFIHGK
jgi:hypothetical protein